jgi:hypothetical protein
MFMTSHYDLHVVPIGDLWRMTATEDGQRRPHLVRDFCSATEALEHARKTSAELIAQGITVSVHAHGGTSA